MKWLIVLPLMLTSGCAGMLNFTPTMEADPSEIGGEGMFLINELSKAYVKMNSEFCDETLPSFQESTKYPYSRYDGPNNKAAQKFRCIGFKQATNAEVANHLRAGFNLSDLYCDTFFRRIAKNANKRRFGRNITNDVGAAVSTALALASAGAAVTGGAGAGFGLIDSSFRNYDDSFLVTAELQVLQPKVHAEQATYKALVYASMPTNYFDANMAIIKYANFCSFVGMKALLNEAVVRSTNPNAARDAIQAYAVDTATNREAQDVAILERQAELAERRKAAQDTIAAAAAPLEGESETPEPEGEPTDGLPR